MFPIDQLFRVKWGNISYICTYLYKKNPLKMKNGCCKSAGEMAYACWQVPHPHENEYLSFGAAGDRCYTMLFYENCIYPGFGPSFWEWGKDWNGILQDNAMWKPQKVLLFGRQVKKKLLLEAHLIGDFAEQDQKYSAKTWNTVWNIQPFFLALRE